MAKSGTHGHESEESLRRLLCDYLLTKGEGSMGRLIDELVFYHRSRGQDLDVDLKGQANIFHQRVHQLLTNWGITIDTGAVDAKGENVHSITIPNFDSREPDHPLIASFLLRETTDLYTNSAERGTARSISLLLLWFLLAYPSWSFRIRRENDGYIRMKKFIKRAVAMTSSPCIDFVPGLRAGRPELTTSVGWLDDLIKQATEDSDIKPYMKSLMMYGRSNTFGSKFVQWYLNWDEQAARKSSFKYFIPQVPVNCACQAMSNLRFLYEQGDIDKLSPDIRDLFVKALQLRRELLEPSAKVKDVEMEVASRLGMDWDQYREFTEKNHINLLFQKPDTVVEDCHEAENFLLGLKSDKDQASSAGDLRDRYQIARKEVDGEIHWYVNGQDKGILAKQPGACKGKILDILYTQIGLGGCPIFNS